MLTVLDHGLKVAIPPRRSKKPTRVTLTCHVRPFGCADKLSVHYKLGSSGVKVGARVQVHEALPGASLVPHCPPLAACMLPFAHLLLRPYPASYLHHITPLVMHQDVHLTLSDMCLTCII